MNKKIIFLTILLLISIPSVYFFIIKTDHTKQSASNSLPTVTPKSKTISIGTKTLHAELATTPTEWSRGLSNRTSLENNSGMIFVFPTAQIQSFWMKDTLIPLDIIWVANKKVVGVARMFPELGKPNSQLASYQSPVPVDVVIETNLDWTKTNDIKIGDAVNF